MLTEPKSDSLLTTRQSLLSRLRDCQNQQGWREFFDTYWRLIYRVARQAGLDDPTAQQVVQNTFIYLSPQLPKLRSDPSRGSLKSWLQRVTRSRIALVGRQKQDTQPPGESSDRDQHEKPEAASHDLTDPVSEEIDAIWRDEWEKNLLKAALRRVSSKVSAQQLMIFELAALGEVPLKQVARKLDVSLFQVYLARYRAGRLFKAELKRLRRETE
jgi:RNA polymerase sigma factor (sigma-70 family)